MSEKPLLCVRSGFEAGARDVQVDWSDNAVSRTRMELGSEEALTDSKPYQLRRYDSPFFIRSVWSWSEEPESCLILGYY